MNVLLKMRIAQNGKKEKDFWTSDLLFLLLLNEKIPISNEKELLEALSVAMIRDNSSKLRFISLLSQLRRRQIKAADDVSQDCSAWLDVQDVGDPDDLGQFKLGKVLIQFYMNENDHSLGYGWETRELCCYCSAQQLPKLIVQMVPILW